MLENLVDLLRRYAFWNFSWRSIFEILIIAFIFYQFLMIIKTTKTFTLLKGIIMILTFVFLATILKLDTLLWLIGQGSTVAILAIIVIFQEELRNALEKIGKNSWMSKLIPSLHSKKVDASGLVYDKICQAVFRMAAVKTGALIVLQQRQELNEIIDSGVEIEGIISTELLINIFEKNTPLHDCAVIIRKDLIAAANCLLPESSNRDIPQHYGTRHRAALGITEISDAKVVVVSEETGIVSVVEAGVIKSVKSITELKQFLTNGVSSDENIEDIESSNDALSNDLTN